MRRLLTMALGVGLIGCLWAPGALAAIGPPTAAISGPATGGSYTLNQPVATTFSCAAPRGATLRSCTDSNGATGGTGALKTGAAGTFFYKVTATDTDGQSGRASITYTVIGRPTAQITAPASGQAYELNQVVSTNFTCTEGPNGPGIATCMDSNGSGSPGRLNTSVAGAHRYTVTATSRDGLHSTTRISYRVIGPPSVRIDVPGPRQLFNLGQKVVTRFSCVPAVQGPAIASCLDASGHGSPGTLDTSGVGGHRYSVTAKAADGESRTSTVIYYVAGRPTATIAVPAVNARYVRGSIVNAAYACSDGTDGPGLSACAGSASTGAPIDTRTRGRHVFIVTAVSRDGQRTTVRVRYTVVRPSNHFTVSHLRLGRKGVLRLWVIVPGAGSLTFRETARIKRSRPRTFIFCKTHRRARRAGILHLTIRPNKRGRRYLHHLHRRLTIRLYVSYTPRGGIVRRHRPVVVRGPRRR